MKWIRLLLLTCAMMPFSSALAGPTFHNPVMLNAPDPFAMRHTDGFYYFLATRQNRIDLVKSSTLTGIGGGALKTIWTPSQGGGCCELWAPEIHYLDGRWYVYYTASTGGGDASRRIYVLENSAADPMTGTWIMRGAVNTSSPGALDGTVWMHNGIRYFLWSGYGNWPNYGSAVFIARMSSPWTLTGAQNVIAQPTAAWENVGGMAINEGPAPLVRGNRMFMIFSAGACWSDGYSLGMLSASTSADPMNPASWTKSPGPVFSKSTGNSVYAPGHNSFVKSPNGQEDWIVYHANPGAGQGCGTLRSTRVQRVNWNADGSPNFGAPEPEWAALAKPAGEPTSFAFSLFESLNIAGHFIRHRDARGRIDTNVAPVQDSQWRIVPGLANSSAISFESINFPGRFLRHRDGAIWSEPSDGSVLFQQDATWWRRAGLANSAHASFESFNFPGRYIRHRDFLLYSEAVSDTLGRNDATFIQRTDGAVSAVGVTF